MNDLRTIAIHLPQYHPIPENDTWWGKGFTEWTNVTRATPLFKGHYQPQLPADLGFYDLRLPLILEQQAAMAKAAGIDGFCFYHYWFNGKLLLQHPIEHMLQSGTPDFPFMLCWANENWTRRWDGLDHEVLLEQHYSLEDDERHMEYLIPFLKDKRYICVDGRPVVIVYKSFLLPNPAETAARWRAVAKNAGLELYLCHMVFGYETDYTVKSGFDAAIDFEPFGVRHPEMIQAKVRQSISGRLKKKLLRVIRRSEINKESLKIWDYESLYNNLKSLSSLQTKIFPSVAPGWDNTARRGKTPTLILENSTPENFQQWLIKIVNDFQPYSKDENFVFINAWNEWAEGNHLEPCKKWGHRYLDALRQVMLK